MKTLNILVIASMAFCASSCGTKVSFGSTPGPMPFESFESKYEKPIEDFDTVIAEGTVDIDWKESVKPKTKISISIKDRHDYTCVVKDKVLTITCNTPQSQASLIDLKVYSPKLKKIVARNGGRFQAFHITVDKLDVEVASRGFVSLNGECNDLNLTVSDHARFNGPMFDSETANCRVTGISEARVSANKQITIYSEFQSHVIYSGKATNVSTSGNGFITKF